MLHGIILFIGGIFLLIGCWLTYRSKKVYDRAAAKINQDSIQLLEVEQLLKQKLQQVREYHVTLMKIAQAYQTGNVEALEFYSEVANKQAELLN
jgi:hypothetical protein